MKCINANGSVEVPNDIILSNKLSLKAKGLYVLIKLNLEIKGFEFKKNNIIQICKDGESSFNSAWKELKNNKLLSYEKIQTDNGFRYKYELMEGVK